MDAASLPAWLLLAEMLLCFGLVFGLHSMRRRTSLVFSIASLTFMTFASWAAPHQTEVSVGPLDFYVESNVFFSAALLNVFLLYVADGPRLGRIGLAIVIGTGLVYTLVALLLHAQFPEARVADAIFPSASPRSATASLIASLLDLVVLGVSWEFFQRGRRVLGLGFRVFLTLLLVLLVDSLVYIPLAWGESPAFASMLGGSMVSRTASACVYAPLVTAYLRYEMRAYGLTLTGRPLLSILTREDLERELVSTRHNLRLGAEALWESEERYRRMVDDLPTMVFRFSLDGMVTYANQALRTYYGRSTEQLLGQHVLAPVPKKDRERTWNEILRLRPHEPVIQVLTHAYPKPGERRLQRWTIRGIFGKDGHGLAFQAVGEDVTQQAKAEERIRQFDAALERAREFVLMVDERGAISHINAALASALGRPAEQFKGKLARRLLGFVLDRGAARELWAEVSAGRPWLGRLLVRFPALGERVLRFSATPLPGDEWVAPGVVLVGHDITEELQLEKRTQDLEKAEALGRMAAGVAHDFSNLIQVIWGCTEAASEDLAGSTDERARDVRLALQDIRQSADRAALLARQLMTLGRQDQAQPGALSVDEAVRRIAPLLGHFVPGGVSLELRLDSDDATALIDASLFERVLINLVTNARDATNAGDRIVVRTRCVSIGDERHGALSELDPGNYALLCVEDNGQGMDEETQRKIFDPFFTTKATGRGTGLGLATVLAIVREAGGTVAVRSRPGEGTQFEVYLPRADIPAYPSLVPGSTRPLVLFCEGDQDVRERLAVSLQLAGYRVVVAATMGALLDQVKDDLDAKRIFLIDVVTTDEAGTPAIDLIRSRFPSDPIVLLSSASPDQVPLTRRSRSRVVLLRKPFGRPELLAALEMALELSPAGT